MTDDHVRPMSFAPTRDALHALERIATSLEIIAESLQRLESGQSALAVSPQQ